MPTATRAERLLAAVALSAVFLLAGCGSEPRFVPSSAGELCVATSLPAPGCWQGQDGGLEGALVSRLAERLGAARVRVVDVPLAALSTAVPAGCDVGVAQLVPTGQRRAVTSFTSAYLRADLAVVVAGDREVPDVAAAERLRWGVERASSGASVLREAVPTVTPDELPDLGALLDAVASGRVDAVVLDLPVALVALRDRPGLRVATRFARADQYAVAVRDPAQRAAVDRAVRALVAEGVVDRLAQRYLAGPATQDPATVPVLRTQVLS